MMELVWTPEAIQDREGIYDYVESENPLAALALDELFSDKADLLVDHPYSGREGKRQVRKSWLSITITCWFTMWWGRRYGY